MLQFPVVLRLDDDAAVNGRLVLLGVVLPLSPLIVITGRPVVSVELALHELSSGTLDFSCTVIVLGAHGHGVVWLAVATVQLSG